jgi:hypothetical protein
VLHPESSKGLTQPSLVRKWNGSHVPRAFLVAGDVGLLELVSGTTTLEVGNGAFVFICSLHVIERSKAYRYCCQ